MMEGLGVNFLSAPAPVSTNSLQKDEVHAQVCNKILQWSEPVELKLLASFHCKRLYFVSELSYLFMF